MDALLLLHIGGAALTGLISLTALATRLYGSAGMRAGSLMMLPYFASAQLVTGVLLAVRSPETSIWAMCDTLGAYLAAVLLVFIVCRACDGRFIVPRRHLSALIASCGLVVSAALAGL